MASQKNSTTTLKDIAERVGCSENTVSLAMRNSPRISESMRREIHSVADRLGYVPNLAARSLVTQRSGIIGLYVRALQDAVRNELANSLLKKLHTAEYRPLLGVSQPESEHNLHAPWMETFRAMNVEALVIVCETNFELPAWAQRIPRVMVANQPDPDLTCDYVALDRSEGARLGITHLMEQGHQKILIACPREHPFTRGCIRTMEEAGLQPEMAGEKSSGAGLIEAALQQVSRKNAPPTAVIFGDSPTAATFLHEVHHKTNVDAGSDLAVVGYDYFPWADMLRVPLTTIQQPIHALATTATELVKSRLADTSTPPKHKILEHKLIIRESSR